MKNLGFVVSGILHYIRADNYIILRVYWAGNVNLKVVPLPNCDSTFICPPIFSTNILQMDSPNPVPCMFSFAFTKRLKMVSNCSGAIPIPVSVV